MIICDDLRWSAMLLDAQNRKKMAHFIAACGRAYTLHDRAPCNNTAPELA